MVNNMGIIEDRRSIRKYKKKVVNDKDIKKILLAGMAAPSPKNRQPWKFIVLKESDKIQLFADTMREAINKKILEKDFRQDIRMSLETIETIKSVSVLILVCYEYGTVIMHDDGVNWPIKARDIEAAELQAIGAAVENMLLKAQELGIGSLWCADVLYAYEVLKEYSNMPVVSAVCLGYADETPACRKRRKFDDVCTILQ